MLGKFKSRLGIQGQVLACLPIVFACFGAEAASYTVPSNLGGIGTGVPQAGYPDFNNLSQLKFEKLSTGSYRLTATGTSAMTFNNGPASAQSFNVSDSSFKLTANFTRSLAFSPVGSAVDITGKIQGYNGPGQLNFGYTGNNNVTNKVGNLYHANLLGIGFDSSPSAIGFTTDAATDSGWASQFMFDNESVWFYSTSFWKTISTAVATQKGKTWSISLNNVQTVTTVPVPGAVWLLGSALMGFAGVARRRQAQAVAA